MEEILQLINRLAVYGRRRKGIGITDTGEAQAAAKILRFPVRVSVVKQLGGRNQTRSRKYSRTNPADYRADVLLPSHLYSRYYTC